MARILVLLKYGKHYVADEDSSLEPGCDYARFACFDLATGGTVRVPIENLAAVEHYADSDIEAFRRRLHEVEEGGG